MEHNNDMKCDETEERIIQAALEIVKDRPYKRIGVTEICKKANIGRKTFYNHFNDIVDLFDTIMKRNSVKLSGELMISNDPLNETFFIPILRHISKDILLHRALSGQIRHFPVKYFLFNTLFDKVERKCRERGITDENEIMYYCAFIQAGGIMCIKRWLDNNCTDSPEMISKVLYENIRRIMGNDKS